ncbi:hypothetical protein [Paraliobacillus ryukyuensis]|uniref:hypothetical protein n=1 Tax=Paraliobacillus ryukyuensis TaxID=200904 RepID=UPI0009A613FB|nr:hypothetical protein [Paraliobacillus ryukyuensis]
MNKLHLSKMHRFNFLDFSNRVTIRTFNKDTYILRSSLIVQHVETFKLHRLEEIYYEIRTVRSIEGIIIAKRKNKEDELCLLTAG